MNSLGTIALGTHNTADRARRTQSAPNARNVSFCPDAIQFAGNFTAGKRSMDTDAEIFAGTIT